MTRRDKGLSVRNDPVPFGDTFSEGEYKGLQSSTSDATWNRE